MVEVTSDLNGFRIVKALGLAPSRQDSFAGALGNLREQELGLRRALARNSLAVRIFGASATAAAVIFAVRGLALPPARFIALVVALSRLLQVGSRLMEGWRQVVHALPAHARALNPKIITDLGFPPDFQPVRLPTSAACSPWEIRLSVLKVAKCSARGRADHRP